MMSQVTVNIWDMPDHKVADSDRLKANAVL